MKKDDKGVEYYTITGNQASMNHIESLLLKRNSLMKERDFLNNKIAMLNQEIQSINIKLAPYRKN